MNRAPLFAALFAPALLAVVHTDAAPVRFDDIAADSAWFVHFDVDRVRLEKPLVPEGPFADKVAAWRAHFEAFSAKLAIDPGTQLSGVTLYGRSAAEAPVALFYHNVPAATVRASLASAQGVETVESGGVKLARIARTEDEASARRFPYAYVAVADSGTVVISGDAAATVAAAAALGGAGFAPTAEWGAFGAGRTPQVSGAVIPSRLKAEMHSRRIRQADSASFAFERKGDAIDFRAKATMPDAKAADDTVRMAGFFRGMLDAGALPEGRKVLDAASVSSSANTVSLDYAGSLADVTAAVRSFQGRVKAARDARGE